MILSEVVFYRGSEFGQILEDLDAGRVQFKPVEGNKRLAGRIVSFALVVAIGPEKRCSAEPYRCRRQIQRDSTAIRAKELRERLFSIHRFLENGLLCYLVDPE